MSASNPWKKLGERFIYENPWMRLREDDVISPGGSRTIYGVVETRVATGVVALTDDDEVYLVGQYRYPLDVYSWEIPEGGANVGEVPLAAAQRELAEEAGVVAEAWEQLGGEIHLSNCFSNERGFLYLARGLSPCELNPDDTEELQIRRVPFEECLRMVDSGEITDSLTVIALLRLARLRGNGLR
jgi:8-oxo-dGTP pyrophosphatase MutT (NUDIX family)